MFGARGSAAALLAAGLIAVPATLLFGVELLGGIISRRVRGALHAGGIGLLAAAIAWQALAQAGLGAGPLRALAFLGAIALASWAYLRFEPVRTLAAVLSFAAPAILLLFLLRPPVTHLRDDGGSAMPEVASRVPVVVVVFDELPLASLLDDRGRIDERVFPAFARLAAGSTWYRRARAVADRTTMAVPAILSGEEPDDSKLPVAADHPRNLFTLLGGTYEETVYESVTDICPRSVCEARLSLAAQTASLLDLVAPEAEPLPGGVLSTTAQWLSDRFPPPPPPEDLAAEFVESLRPAGKPSLHLLHSELPHVPWHLLPGGETYVDPGVPGLDDELWAGPRGQVEAGYQRHLLQLQYTDRLLGRILDRMQETGLYDDALLIVLADHGASFIPRFSRRAVNVFTAGWILPVPFFVKRPGQRGARVSKAPVRTIDVVPTVAAELGVELPWDAPGSPAGSPRPRSDLYQDATGAEVEIADAGIEAALLHAASYRNDLVRSPNLYAWGGRARLMGRRESALPAGARGLDAALDAPEQFEDVEAQGDVPALVTGALGSEPSGPIALLLNGRVAATGRAYPEEGTVRFALVAEPGAFREGRNELRFVDLGAR